MAHHLDQLSAKIIAWLESGDHEGLGVAFVIRMSASLSESPLVTAPQLNGDPSGREGAGQLPDPGPGAGPGLMGPGPVSAVTDLTKWRLYCERGRQRWAYEEEGSEREQTFAELHSLGLDTVSQMCEDG